MNHFHYSVLTASMLLALGTASGAWANPTNEASKGATIGSQDASVDATGKGLGNAVASENSSSTVGDVTKNSNNPDSSIGYDGTAKSDDQGASVNGSGKAITRNTETITETTNKTSTRTSTIARDEGIASSGSGDVTSNSNNTRTRTDVTAKDDAVAANGGNATSTVTTNRSGAKGDGSAATNVGDATAQYIEAKLRGDGNAVAGVGNATSHYKVNNQYLDGSVTGHPSRYPAVDGWELASVPVGNSMNNSVVGNAGVTQTFQNSGNGLAQQSVLIDGTVNVTQGTATLTTP